MNIAGVHMASVLCHWVGPHSTRLHEFSSSDTSWECFIVSTGKRSQRDKTYLKKYFEIRTNNIDISVVGPGVHESASTTVSFRIFRALRLRYLPYPLPPATGRSGVTVEDENILAGKIETQGISISYGLCGRRSETTHPNSERCSRPLPPNCI
jgi:hypothetical protein